MIKKKLFSLFLLPILFFQAVKAHCPLCTVGAGAAAAGAIWLGVSKVGIGLFIGGFAMSLGIWISKIPKKRYVPFQRTLIISVIVLTTILPLLPIFSAIGPLYLPFIGGYGKTYAIDYSLMSSFLGAIITFISPGISRQIIKMRDGKIFPFQGTLITLFSLIFAGLAIQLIL